MKKIEKRNVNASIAIIISVVFITILVSAMFIIIGRNTSKDTKNSLQSVAVGRTNAVASYFEDANKKLELFGSSSVVRDLLKDQRNPEKIAKAQDYTEEFGAQLDNLEGIYIATWDTEVLTHTNPKVVGMVTRPKDKDFASYKVLVNTMENKPDHLYTTGVIKSPASGEYVYSAYRAVYSEGLDPKNESDKPIGYVGIGIHAESIIKQLPDPNLRDVNEWNYYIVNMDSNSIISSTDEDLVGTEIDNNKIKSIISEIHTASDMSYREALHPEIVKYDGHSSCVVTFGTYKTAVILETKSSELYSMVRKTYVCLGIFIAAMTLVFIATTYVTRRQEKFRIEMNKQRQQNENMRSTLNDAVFNDLLTGVKNRASFQIDTEKIFVDKNETLIFGMVSIDGLKNINANYGNETGDAVITETANYCSKVIENAEIYRTGSSEFMIVKLIKNTDNDISSFIYEMNDLKTNLSINYHSTPAGNIAFPCKLAVAKKSKNINTSIITILKANISTMQDNSNIPFYDLDE